MDISTLSEKKNRLIRLRFTRFLVNRYGENFQRIRGKLYSSRIRKWELVGIESCILEFSPEYDGEMKDFLATTDRKTKFYYFMELECGMSTRTAFVRFQKFNFSELELKGLNAVYAEFQDFKEKE